MTNFDRDQHHRRSIRLPGYDYAQAGAYFVTIVTWHRECLFGEIIEGEIHLNEVGKIADACWHVIPDHFPHVELGVYVIMPNHVHGILVIKNNVDAAASTSTRRGTIYPAPTEQFQKPVSGSIPTIVRTYKAAVTRRIAREHNTTGIWQRNYYEHIIRNEKDLHSKTDYIHANPLLWEQDHENPINLQQ